MKQSSYRKLKARCRAFQDICLQQEEVIAGLVEAFPNDYIDLKVFKETLKYQRALGRLKGEEKEL